MRYPLDAFSARMFICLDEWGWLILCAYLFHRWTERMGIDHPREDKRRAWKLAFWVVFVPGAVMNYGIAYPAYFGWIAGFGP
jgi:hypothetical protein